MRRQNQNLKAQPAKRRPAIRHQQQQSRATTFDQDSGLVYKETHVSGRSSSGWIVDYKTPSIVKTRPKLNENGARCLADMVLSKLGVESQDLTVEALETLPWPIGQRIWQHIIGSHAESFYIWRTFATAFTSDFAGSSRRYMIEIRSPSLPQIEYYNGIKSLSRDWLTCLRVSPKQIGVHELVTVSTISNLTVLDLSDGQLYIENRASTLDVRVLRSWAEQASAGRAFQSLRVLMLGWQERIDTWLFDLLDAFPRLNVLVLTDCRLIHHKNHKEWEEDAWKHGWTFMPSKRGAKHLRTLLDDRSFYVANISNMHYESERLLAETSSKQSDKRVNRPLLECRLGTPRKWTHIIDEFPGTKTVYLERVPRIENVVPPAKLPSIQPNKSKRELSSPSAATTAQRMQSSAGKKQRMSKHSAVSLLAEMS